MSSVKGRLGARRAAASGSPSMSAAAALGWAVRGSPGREAAGCSVGLTRVSGSIPKPVDEKRQRWRGLSHDTASRAKVHQKLLIGLGTLGKRKLASEPAAQAR